MTEREIDELVEEFRALLEDDSVSESALEEWMLGRGGSLVVELEKAVEKEKAEADRLRAENAELRSELARLEADARAEMRELQDELRRAADR